MIWITTGLLILTCLWLLLEGLTRPGKVYEFPFLAAAITTAWVLPQLPGLAVDPFLPPGSYERAVGFTAACLAACRIGWRPQPPAMAAFRWAMDEKRLLIAAAILSVGGGYFYYLLSRVPGDLAVASGMTGWAVVMFFFSKLLPYGMTIALLCLVHRPSPLAIAIVAVDALFYVDRIFVTGKRAETTGLILMIALAVWFYHRRAIPGIVVVLGMVFGMLSTTSTHDYRELTRADGAPTLSKLADISLIGNFEKLLSQGGAEMQNAILRMNMVAHNQQYDFGLSNWNILVFNFIPAQVVGPRFKASLMVDGSAQIERDYSPLSGTTETGMTDAFASFWYFGWIKFLLIAYVLSRLYGSAMSGQIVPQILYILLIVSGMQTITHHTQAILSEAIQIMVFVMPLLLFARARPVQATGITTLA